MFSDFAFAPPYWDRQSCRPTAGLRQANSPVCILSGTHSPPPPLRRASLGMEGKQRHTKCLADLHQARGVALPFLTASSRSSCSAPPHLATPRTSQRTTRPSRADHGRVSTLCLPPRRASLGRRKKVYSWLNYTLDAQPRHCTLYDGNPQDHLWIAPRHLAPREGSR